MKLRSEITRRDVIEATAGIAAGSILLGCGSSSTAGATTSSPAATNPQPTPAGALTQASMAVAATAVGSIGPAFAGLSYEKNALYEPLFTPSNSNLIGLFQRLGSSVLRIGGNSVDKNVWTPNGKG